MALGWEWATLQLMSSSRPAGGRQERAFSLPVFTLTVFAAFFGLVVVLRLLAPQAVWHAQVAARFWQYVVALLAIELVDCFIEYFFHRYLLHQPPLPLLSYFYRQHTKHHALTRIVRRRLPGGREIPFVENRYPITRPEQREASFFPWYSLPVFALLMTPLLALLQWMLPSFPWFLSGYGALALSLSLYEVLHAIEHLAFESWAPLIESRRWGWLWRRAYSFHLRHHAVIDCNESISGFFALPVADWVFGTCAMPKTLYADGEEWQPSHFQRPRPRWIIRACDRAVSAMAQRRRRARPRSGAPSR
jgi:hemolysin III